MIFDVKMEDFWRKPRFIIGGHMPDNLHTMRYASIVLWGSIHIALTLDALNELDVKMVDI
jgi:hypothetical protein